MGQRCPYLEHEPRTEAGWQAWDVITRCASQLRIAPSAVSVLGIDMAAAMLLAEALGYDLPAVADLLQAAETGLANALNERLANQYD